MCLFHAVHLLQLISRFSHQDEFEDDTAKSLAICLNFCMVDDLMAPCILKDR